MFAPSTVPSFFSREALAGYDREILEHGVITLIGCGAGANNEALNLALAGVGELRFVDFDTIEPSNLTRSPLFRRDVLRSGQPRHKARELANAALELSYAARPIVRFATSRIEELGMGALVGSGAVISAVDSFAVRALLSDWCRLLQIPLIEGGFSGSRCHVTVWPNQRPDEPCWRCVHPDVTYGGVSCTTYARAVAATGAVPATQPLAAAVGAIMAEAAILALHGQFPLGGRLWSFDVRSGESSVFDIGRDEHCPGVHRQISPPRPLAARSCEPLKKVFDAVRDALAEPVVHLPFPFIVEAPCANCGATLHIGRPSWSLREPPTCAQTCAPPDEAEHGELFVVTQVRAGDALATRRCRTLGLPPAAVFEIEDAATGELHAVALDGTVENVFSTKTREAREERNAAEAARMDQEGERNNE